MKGLLAAALLVTLTACGGGGDGDSGGSSGGDFASAQEVVDAIGCVDYTGDSEEMFVTEGGTCTLDGKDVYVAWFKNEKAQSNWTDVAGEMSGDLILAGDGWSVYGPGRATLESIREDLGGDIS